MSEEKTTIQLMITEIEWDFDGENDDAIEEAYCYLPSVPFFIDVDFDGYDMDAIPVADAISDEHGWCVKNCDYEIVK